MPFTAGTNITRQAFVNNIVERFRDYANPKISPQNTAELDALNNTPGLDDPSPGNLDATHLDFPGGFSLAELPFGNINVAGDPGIEAFIRNAVIVFSRVRPFRYKVVTGGDHGPVGTRFTRRFRVSTEAVDDTASEGPNSLYRDSIRPIGGNPATPRNISASVLNGLFRDLRDDVLNTNHNKTFDNPNGVVEIEYP